MRGIEANAEALGLARFGNDEGKLLESVAQTRTLAGRCLERDFRSYFGNGAKNRVDRIDDLAQTRFLSRAQVRAGMQNEKW